MHLGVIGYGNIGRMVCQLLEEDPVEKLTILVRSAAKTTAEHNPVSAKAAGHVEVKEALPQLIANAPNLVVECAGQEAVGEYVGHVLEAGIPTVVVSVGALAEEALLQRLREAANSGGSKLILPAGAIGGIDLLAAIAPAGGVKVRYRCKKPPAAWKGTPAESAVDLEHLLEPTVFFSGNARDAARLYPRNANVAATLALAGPGFDATEVELVADPAATGNSHSYTVESPMCRFSVDIENTASRGNVKTSATTAYSVLREVRRVHKALII